MTSEPAWASGSPDSEGAYYGHGLHEEPTEGTLRPTCPSPLAPPALTAMCSDGTPHSRPLLRKEVLEAGAWPGCGSTATLHFSPVFRTHVFQIVGSFPLYPLEGLFLFPCFFKS